MALLRGKISIADNIVIWSGKWGFTKDSFKDGDTGKFVIKAAAPEAVVAAGTICRVRYMAGTAVYAVLLFYCF
jgi:hypothetical protein